MTAVRILAAVLLATWLPGSVAAQTNAGEIVGSVRDSSGAALPGVHVIAVQPATGAAVERTSDSQGRFFLPDLRIGVWEVSATLGGFSTQMHAGVVVEIGRIVSLEFVLGPEGLSENVVVSAQAPLLQTATAEISDVIGQREVVEFPLNGRHFLALAQLSDGVVLPPGGTRGDALQQAGPLPNVGGQRSGHNIYLFDGAKITDELFNNLVISPSVDAIEEFKIQKSMYQAEFGGKASALINVASRAGSNTLRGSLFEFYRNDALDAENYFHPAGQPGPPLTQHQFGGAVGGPLVANRTFAFASGEGTRMTRALTRTFSVPTAAVRTGDFTGHAAICDPLTVATTGACQPFPANRIPSGRIDPVADAFLRRVPLPTSSATLQNLTAEEVQDRQLEQLTVRIDHRIGITDSLFARVSTFDADETQPFGASALQEALVPGFGRSLTTTARNAVVSHSRVIGGRTVNEIRAAWLSVQGGQASVNRGVDFAGQVGLQGVTRDARDVGFPQVSTGGLYHVMGDPTSFITRANRHVELYDNVTVDRGAHRVKFGGYYFHLWLRPEQPDTARGAYTYSGQFTGNALADFLLGYPASASAGIGRGDEDGRTTWVHVYGQDDWQPRGNLTVNLGLRYEFNQHMYDVRNRLSSIDLSTPGGRVVVASDAAGRIDPSAQALLPLIPIPYVTSAEARWGRGLLSPSAVRLAPRTGFALSLRDGRAVVRGGYGIFLNQWAYSVQTAFARNLPFFVTKQVDVPLPQRVPALSTRDILVSGESGAVGGTIMDFDYNVEYSQSWSGGLQYEIGPSTMVEITYMGTWTLGADNATVRNVPEPGPGSIDARRPIPRMSRINAIRFDGKSIYHGLTLKAERRMSRNLAWNVNYTLSRSLDDASSPGPTESEANVPQNVRNIFDETGEWARSSFDHRHLVAASGTYALPELSGGRGLAAALFNGWRVSAVATAQSGAPFTVNLGVDRANIGTGPAQRPDQPRNANLPGGQRTPDRWFDVSAFALPAPFTFGSAPRNSVIGPGFASVDVAVAKIWAVGATPRLELRWEVFNLLNRANLDLPSRIFGSPNFGRVFSAKSPREMQVGVRYAF
jgi:hypothetical protein